MTMNTDFKAWRVEEHDGSYVGSEQTLNTADLPEGEVLIRVSHSSLNYKDALSASGNKGVTRSFPHTPGIDAAGEVVEDASGKLASGTAVLVTGFDLGMNTDGGFGEYIRVPTGWCVPMPAGWDARTAMIYGTAGLTAGLCVQKLLTMGAQPAQGPVAVSGASGAVGSVAVELLAKLGFEVVAISGKADHAADLKALGASDVVGREALSEEKKPMLKPVYGNAVDTVGGTPLAELLKQIKPGGSVSCCGLVAGPQLQTTVLPFILRGVNLLGVDSVEIPLADKQAVWGKFSGDWACPKTEQSARDIGRSELDAALKAFLGGASVGKTVLDHSR
ncbi:YhdH/YhfP family quinone oxidoreductase [Marinobacter alexandrii]|uniref:YhdH/YhfP family quinone oxidoreductase n=1 Tax=Marinobacter alexandrii TaxID=2570351 RepID=UPI001FFFA778|nr:YhdH/YhfP family quinone oxidoreductase [Marinobacter alexandrii]MCK2147668.1 YhdH/YhfP family quinone oxidoreductase [Marinobacter alexandrii]